MGASPQSASGFYPTRLPLPRIFRPASTGHLNRGHWGSSSGKDLEPPVVGTTLSRTLLEDHSGSFTFIVKWPPMSGSSGSRWCHPGIFGIEPSWSVSPGFSPSRGPPVSSVLPLVVTVLGSKDPRDGSRGLSDFFPASLIPCSEVVVSRACLHGSPMGQTKHEIQFCQNSPGETVGERSHFSSPPAFLNQNSLLQPLFPSPQPLSIS